MQLAGRDVVGGGGEEVCLCVCVWVCERLTSCVDRRSACSPLGGVGFGFGFGVPSGLQENRTRSRGATADKTRLRQSGRASRPRLSDGVRRDRTSATTPPPPRPAPTFTSTPTTTTTHPPPSASVRACVCVCPVHRANALCNHWIQGSMLGVFLHELLIQISNIFINHRRQNYQILRKEEKKRYKEAY